MPLPGLFLKTDDYADVAQPELEKLDELEKQLALFLTEDKITTAQTLGTYAEMRRLIELRCRLKGLIDTAPEDLS